MLKVTTYDGDEEVETTVDFVSFVSPETYGPPALIAPARGRDEARARVGQSVLYINTRTGQPMCQIVRESD